MSPLRSAQCARSVRVVSTDIPDRRRAEHSTLTASERSQRARLAATSRWSKEDGSQGTQVARTAFLARFEREVDPDGVLPLEERVRRAEAAKRAYFQRLAFNRHRKTA